MLSDYSAECGSMIAVKKQRLRIIFPRPLSQLPSASPLPRPPQASQPASIEPADTQQKARFWRSGMLVESPDKWSPATASNRLPPPAVNFPRVIFRLATCLRMMYLQMPCPKELVAAYARHIQAGDKPCCAGELRLIGSR